MPRPRAPLAGERLSVNDKIIDFSFWPVKSIGRGPRSIQTQVFTNDPWNIIESIIIKKCPPIRKDSAKYFFAQAHDFYVSSLSSSIVAAKPLQIYYCLLNLVKSYILTFGSHDNLDNIQHGLSENNSGAPIENHYIVYYQSNRSNLNAFHEFFLLLTGTSLPNNTRINIKNLLEQIILGHRLWCDATINPERFIRVRSIEYMKSTNREIWIRLFIVREEVSRLHLNENDIMRFAGLDSDFSLVNNYVEINGKECICYEQIRPVVYTRTTSDKLNQLSNILKGKVWEVLIDAEPYKKYYLFLNHSSIRTMHQLCSIYALSFYFSSITRYRPKQFISFLDSDYGPQIKEIINNQILQTVYSMASEFSKRDISKPNFI